MLQTAINAAKEAGEILMKFYGNVSAQQKGEFFDSASILTEADLESKKAILKTIKEKFPEHNIYSEEAGEELKGSEFTWYIDPLDGTGNFSRNIPLFGTSIGLLKNGKPFLGVLYFPVFNLLIYAEEGKGAFADGKQIKVSNRDLKSALYYSGGYYKGNFQIESGVAEKTGILKIIDASSYELAHIAMGGAEIYILKNIPHDVAAGAIIIKEAGGKVTDIDGSDWNVDSKMIVATNGAVHEEVLSILIKNV